MRAGRDHGDSVDRRWLRVDEGPAGRTPGPGEALVGGSDRRRQPPGHIHHERHREHALSFGCPTSPGIDPSGVVVGLGTERGRAVETGTGCSPSRRSPAGACAFCTAGEDDACADGSRTSGCTGLGRDGRVRRRSGHQPVPHTRLARPRGGDRDRAQLPVALNLIGRPCRASQATDVVLVLGASGAVGTAAVQLAKLVWRDGRSRRWAGRTGSRGGRATGRRPGRGLAGRTRQWPDAIRSRLPRWRDPGGRPRPATRTFGRGRRQSARPARPDRGVRRPCRPDRRARPRMRLSGLGRPSSAAQGPRSRACGRSSSWRGRDA